MNRKITAFLEAWKDGPHRMPLLLEGARHVGKTYAVLEFGRTHYDNVAYINFELHPELAEIFESNITPEYLIPRLSLAARQTICRGATLIVLDEVQCGGRALASLKYFKENAPEYHVIAIASLLGVAKWREHFSFPVGTVDRKTMHPMDLEEFMLALGRGDVVEAIRKAYQTDKPLPSVLHDMAMQIWCQYLAVGGMPACVAHFAETGDHLLVRHLQDTILASYREDMGKYSTPGETQKKRLLWDSVPEQLAKENNRFRYALVKQGRRLTMLDHAVALLCEAGIASRVYRVSEGKKPLDSYVDRGAFKLYSADHGLLAAQRKLAPAEILYMREKSRVQERIDPFLCGLVENTVAMQLQQNGLRTHYWYPKGDAQSVLN